MHNELLLSPETSCLECSIHLNVHPTPEIRKFSILCSCCLLPHLPRIVPYQPYNSSASHRAKYPLVPMLTCCTPPPSTPACALDNDAANAGSRRPEDALRDAHGAAEEGQAARGAARGHGGRGRRRYRERRVGQKEVSANASWPRRRRAWWWWPRR